MMLLGGLVLQPSESFRSTIMTRVEERLQQSTLGMERSSTQITKPPLAGKEGEMNESTYLHQCRRLDPLSLKEALKQASKQASSESSMVGYHKQMFQLF